MPSAAVRSPALLRSAREASSAVPDAELVLRAREGEEWAQAAIYQRYAPLVGNLAARLLGNRDDAMEVRQDVFVDALRRLDTLRDPSCLRAWLVRCAVHRANGVFRKRKLRRLFGLDRTVDDLTLDQMVSPDASPEMRAELAEISRVLRSMPARQRFAWVLHCVEGETLPAIAEATSTSLATVKRDIAAARALIDEALGEEGAR
jgi:RNA polymerase sigma-70 factor, ECF subfamily